MRLKFLNDKRFMVMGIVQKILVILSAFAVLTAFGLMLVAICSFPIMIIFNLALTAFSIEFQLTFFQTFISIICLLILKAVFSKSKE